MKTICGLLLGFAMLSTLVTWSTVVANQTEKKPWTEWSQKEAERMLKDSPWAKVQTDTDTTEMFFKPTSDPRMTPTHPPPNPKERLEQGATNQATNLTYGIRFFSARPVRQAFMRSIQLQQKKLEPEVLERMKNFAEVAATDSIIIAVTVEGTDKRSYGKVMQVIESAASGTLKNTTYLERNDGKRLFLTEYVPPGRDGFGARFIFPRNPPDGEAPFLTSKFTEVRFVSEFGSTVKLRMSFKLADMMFDGALEY